MLTHLAGLAMWRDAVVVSALAPRLPHGDFDALFAMREPHLVPQQYLAMLDACC